jgi:lipoprotein-anchoring transpeptidase ErfK/SrfK
LSNSPQDSRPARLNPPPRRKSRPFAKGSRSRGNRIRSERHDALPYWIAGGLIFLLALLLVAWIEMPRMDAWLHPPKPVLVETPPPTPAPSPEEQARLAREQEEVELARQEAAEKKRQAEEEAAQPKPLPPAAPLPNPVPPPPAAATETEPPLVQPVPLSPQNAPPRALPADPNILTTERIAAYQVALERIHFSCGFVDGDQGMRTQRMLRAYQTSLGLPASGFLDPATRAAIGEPGEPFLTYTVTPDDIAAIMPKPQGWREKAKAKRLGYNNIWEELAEKFHCTRGYLKALNRDVIEPVSGTQIIGPKVFPAAPIPKAASLRVVLSETSIEALDASGRVIAFFPCSIAKDKNKRPNGTLVVKSVVPDPDYTFDPELFADAAKAEGLTHKLLIPPGPRNPVGTAWIGLSLPGYGIHGTPDPEAISRTQSHGCFRLANWNANKVLAMVHVGTPVDVVP